MKKYLITYDLKTQGRDYTGLIPAIQALGPWWHYLQFTWIIKTDISSTDIYNNICRFFDRNDRLLIVEIDASNKHGWLPLDAWTWLDS